MSLVTPLQSPRLHPMCVCVCVCVCVWHCDENVPVSYWMQRAMVTIRVSTQFQHVSTRISTFCGGCPYQDAALTKKLLKWTSLIVFLWLKIVSLTKSKSNVLKMKFNGHFYAVSVYFNVPIRPPCTEVVRAHPSSCFPWRLFIQETDLAALASHRSVSTGVVKDAGWTGSKWCLWRGWLAMFSCSIARVRKSPVTTTG